MTLGAACLHTYPEPVDKVIEVDIVRAADGAAGVGHHPDGRVMFVDGALTGERVAARITKEHKRHLRAVAAEILEPSAERISPVCATRIAGCGGCDFAHAEIATQHKSKAAVVRDALVRIGRVAPEIVDQVLVDVVRCPPDPFGYRTTVRAAIHAGRAGYRRTGSHDIVVAHECRVSHPLAEELLVELRFGPASGAEAMIRVSDKTGERHVVVDGDAGAVEAPAGVEVASRNELEAGRRLSLTEHAADRDWQVSAGSFFQPGPGIATLLAETVAERVDDIDGATLVDAYSGVGLFAGTVGSRAGAVTAIERAGSSTEDARVNLAEIGATIIEADVEKWSAKPADVVIADPARSGLGARGLEVLDGCGANTFVLVSCDTGSMGRDIGLLVQAGYELTHVDLVDAFADTSHIEVVSTLQRSSAS